MTSYVQVLGGGISGPTPISHHFDGTEWCSSILLFLENGSRVLINAGNAHASDHSPINIIDSCDSLICIGEGAQRMATEHKMRLSRCQCILITRISHETIGGLPGMLLTLNDIKAKLKVKSGIYGPNGLSKFVQATRHFIRK
jgi:ribonuclease BN (tRNA processing enzyme)